MSSLISLDDAVKGMFKDTTTIKQVGKYEVSTCTLMGKTDEWRYKGKLHREEGPAMEFNREGVKDYYYLNGKRLSQARWTKTMRKLKMKALGI